MILNEQQMKILLSIPVKMGKTHGIPQEGPVKGTSEIEAPGLVLGLEKVIALCCHKCIFK
jgi:hypothetical protein